MNVSQQNIDTVNAVIKIEITSADYQQKVDSALKTYRQKANVPGFRKGMVPMGMVKKMFGKSVLVEEINKLVSEQLFGYIKEQKLNLLGEPLPSEDQKEFNFDTMENFEFSFDIALAPEFKIELSKSDKIDYYEIEISDEMIQTQIDALAQRFGSYSQFEVAGENDMLKGNLTELEADGTVKEGGIVVKDAILMPTLFINEDQKAVFVNAAKGATVKFNPSASCEANATVLASMLRLNKETMGEITSDFNYEITEITHRVLAEINQELFDNAFGKDTIATEEEFRAKVREMIAVQLAPESDYKFSIDAKTYIESKVGQLEIPVEFLKRWFLVKNEEKTDEIVDEEMQGMIPALQWHLIKEQIATNLDVKVNDSDLLAIAEKMTRAQFAQYGMMDVPDDLLANYSKGILNNKDQKRELIERATEDKLYAAIKEAVTLNVIAISAEDFSKMFVN